MCKVSPRTWQFLSVKCLSQILLVVTSRAYNLKKTTTHTQKNAAIISTKVQLSALSSGWSSGSFPNNVFPLQTTQRSVCVALEDQEVNSAENLHP